MRRRVVWVIIGLIACSSRTAIAYTQLVVFGDSLSDTGNVWDTTFHISPNSSYYNGRFSNGPVWAENLATGLGVTPPTYSRGGGRDYAYGGARTGSGSVSYFPFSFPNVGTQINTYLAGNTPTADELFVVWGGGNDFFDGQTNTATVVNNIANHVTALANAGARDIVVPNLPLLGEVPDFNTTASRATLNSLSSQFNAQLATRLTQLDTQLNLNLFPLDVETTFSSILANPGQYGFTNVTQPAYNGNTVVPNPDQYLFWDGKHPTRVGHQLIAAAATDLVNTHNWVATGTAAWATPGNWDPAAAPTSAWICKLTNNTPAPKAAVVVGTPSVKRVEIGGAAGAATMSVVVQSGAALMASADVRVLTRGALDLQGGTVAAANVDLGGGVLIGDGTVNGALANVSGVVSPGHSVGSIVVNGSYAQQAGGTLAIELGGVTDHDTFAVAGSAALSGALAVRAIDPFIPLPGQSFRVLTYGSRIGDFATLVNQTGRAGLRFNRNYDATGLMLEAWGLPGDANLDAVVDLTDFAFLAGNFNQTNKTWLDADFTADGAVDLTDFTFLASNFNQTLPPADGSLGGSVPEPATPLSISLVALAAASSRRHRLIR